MPAIAALEDVFGWLLRGFLESGLSDGTGHSFVPTETGVMDGGDLLALGRGTQGIRLCFIGQAGDFVDVEDEYTCVVKVVREGATQGVTVRCADTLYFKMFEEKAYEMGFAHAAVGAMVRSSYHADQQAHAAAQAASDT